MCALAGLPVCRRDLRFGLHHGHAGAVHFDIEDRDAGGSNGGKFQLLGAVNLLLLVCFHIGADGFRVPLDTLGGDG